MGNKERNCIILNQSQVEPTPAKMIYLLFVQFVLVNINKMSSFYLKRDIKIGVENKVCGVTSSFPAVSPAIILLPSITVQIKLASSWEDMAHFQTEALWRIPNDSKITCDPINVEIKMIYVFVRRDKAPADIGITNPISFKTRRIILSLRG